MKAHSRKMKRMLFGANRNRRLFSALLMQRAWLHSSLTPAAAVNLPSASPLIVTGFAGPRFTVQNEKLFDEVIEKCIGASSIAAEREALQKRREECERELAALERCHEAIELQCKTYANRAMMITFAALAAQFGVLFNWVFFVFDWNLVEPCTYFFGYTVIWWSLVFYKRTGKDFSYDSIIELLEERKRSKLVKKTSFDEEKFKRLQGELDSIRSALRDL